MIIHNYLLQMANTDKIPDNFRLKKKSYYPVVYANMSTS